MDWSVDQARQLIDPNHPKLSIARQCALLQLNRSSYYYQPQPAVSQEDIQVMGLIDKTYTDFPYYGAPRITAQLRRDGLSINHKRVERLMRTMGIQALRPKKSTSQPNPDHLVYPYLLKNIPARYPNHIWGVDITYIRLKGSFLYLFAVLDWYSRFAIAWELSDSLSQHFCCQALEQALQTALPVYHNSDQGSQLTSRNYLSLLAQHPSIKISMDGRGRCFDNIFTERLWRTVKYEEVYLKDYQSPREARQSLKYYFHTYNHRRLHSSLKYHTPAEVYFGKVII